MVRAVDHHWLGRWPVRPLVAACVAGAVATASAGVAAAAVCTPPPGGDARLSEIDGRVRLAWIGDRLDHGAARGKAWTWSWAIGIGAAGVGSLIAVPFVAPENRVDWYTGAVSAAVGVVPLLVAPPTAMREAPKLRAAMITLRADQDARVCAVLADAEGKLAAAADDQQQRQRWWVHAGNLAFNTGVLLFLGLGYHHWLSGVINGAAGAVVGEALIFTQPTGNIEDRAAYWSFRVAF